MIIMDFCEILIQFKSKNVLRGVHTATKKVKCMAGIFADRLVGPVFYLVIWPEKCIFNCWKTSLILLWLFLSFYTNIFHVYHICRTLISFWGDNLKSIEHNHSHYKSCSTELWSSTDESPRKYFKISVWTFN